MGILTLLLVVTFTAAGAAPTAQNKRQVSRQSVYQPFVGFWKGTLTYRDYTTDKQVTLPTTLEVMATDDVKMRFHYTYDDGPGKQVVETETVAVDVAQSTYQVQARSGKPMQTYRVSGLDAFARNRGGSLVLLGTGIDAGQSAQIRNTLTRRGDTLTMLHEARLAGSAFRFRNRYQLTRSRKPTPTMTRLLARQLQEDFAIFKKAYETLHPGLYRYNTPAQMAQHFQVLEKQLRHDQSLEGAYLSFALFAAKVKCGHTYPNFYNQPDSVVSALFTQYPRIPFYFRWINDKMIITRSLTPDTGLTPGTEVLALNDVPVAQIRHQLLGVARADGSNTAKRLSDLEVQGYGQYEAFDIYFPLFFPFDGNRTKAQVKPPSGPLATRTLTMLSQVQREAVQKQDVIKTAGEDTPAWTLRFLKDSDAALLSMPTWALYNSKWDWKRFLEDAFAQMADKKTKALIIDLRGNEGGLGVGNYLLEKMIRTDLPLTTLQRWVRYRAVPEELVPYLDTWDTSFRNWDKDIAASADSPDDFFRMTRYDDGPGGDVIKASAHPFAGRVYVLVNAANSSATFEFAQILQQNHLATLVGQPTGGNQRGINGGAFFFLRLPNSKIEMDIPLIALFPSDVQPRLGQLTQMSQPDAGLTPDIIVTPRVEDIAAGKDAELAAVQQRLRNLP